jgi:lipoyl(octanoyl) transferase
MLKSRPSHNSLKPNTLSPKFREKIPKQIPKQIPKKNTQTTQKHSFSTPLSQPSDFKEINHDFEPKPRKKVQLYQCLDPQVPYILAYQWMETLLASKTRKENPEQKDILFIVQHQPVYTLGKRASLDNFRFQPNELAMISEPSTTTNSPSHLPPLSATPQPTIPPHCEFDLQRIGRGGEVTYHGPGQLTVYPILNLNNYKKDLHWYVVQLETTVIHTLAKYGIDAGIDPANPGVWIGDSKVSAIGCQFKRWNTMHGFSLNVNRDVHKGFSRIVPCGIRERQVTSIEELVQEDNKIDLFRSNQSSFLPPPQYQSMQKPMMLKKPFNFDIEFVANEIVDSFENVFDVEVIKNDYNVIDFYDRSLDMELAKPRVWLREMNQSLD